MAKNNIKEYYFSMLIVRRKSALNVCWELISLLYAHCQKRITSDCLLGIVIWTIGYDAESHSSNQTTPGLRIINQQPPDGKLSWDFLQELLPGYERMGAIVITYSFPAGCLKGISYEAQDFAEYLPNTNDGWIYLNLLNQAFIAGSIFKIQEVGNRRGNLVWSDDIPHKTNNTEGTENNGYPDPNHTMKLIEALEVKGFVFDVSIPKFWKANLRDFLQH
ncbi:putative E3 ubiquitin-protein ligase DTX3 [Styela clava]